MLRKLFKPAIPCDASKLMCVCRMLQCTGGKYIAAVIRTVVCLSIQQEDHYRSKLSFCSPDLQPTTGLRHSCVLYFLSIVMKVCGVTMSSTHTLQLVVKTSLQRSVMAKNAM